MVLQYNCTCPWALSRLFNSSRAQYNSKVLVIPITENLYKMTLTQLSITGLGIISKIAAEMRMLESITRSWMTSGLSSATMLEWLPGTRACVNPSKVVLWRVLKPWAYRSVFRLWIRDIRPIVVSIPLRESFFVIWRVHFSRLFLCWRVPTRVSTCDSGGGFWTSNTYACRASSVGVGISTPTTWGGVTLALVGATTTLVGVASSLLTITVWLSSFPLVRGELSTRTPSSSSSSSLSIYEIVPDDTRSKF